MRVGRAHGAPGASRSRSFEGRQAGSGPHLAPPWQPDPNLCSFRHGENTLTRLYFTCDPFASLKFIFCVQSQHEAAAVKYASEVWPEAAKSGGNSNCRPAPRFTATCSEAGRDWNGVERRRPPAIPASVSRFPPQIAVSVQVLTGFKIRLLRTSIKGITELCRKLFCLRIGTGQRNAGPDSGGLSGGPGHRVRISTVDAVRVTLRTSGSGRNQFSAGVYDERTSH